MEKGRVATFTLEAANKSTIYTYGQKSVTLDLGLRRSFRWIFVIADVRSAIIGADFLDHFALIVDVKRRRLTDSTTSLCIQGVRAKRNSPSPTFSLIGSQSRYHELLSRFPDITRPNFREAVVKHNVTHHIVTQGPPRNATQRNEQCILSYGY